MEDLHIPPPLAVKVFPGEGRGLVAKEELAAGQAVIRSKAFASVVAAEAIDRFCAFCTRPTKGKPAVRCSQCYFNHYCTDHCRDKDKAVHQLECSALQTHDIGLSDTFRLLLRVLQTQVICREENKTDPLDVLCYSEPVSSIDELYQAVTVKLVHSILTQGGGCVATEKEEEEEEEEEWVSAVLAKLQSNAFSLYHSNQQIIGSAVHTLPALLNHSCEPNCWWVSDGSDITVRTSRRIAPGEQLLVTYASLLDMREVRRHDLMDKYGFTCNCPRCTEDCSVDFLLGSARCPVCSKVATDNKSQPLQGLVPFEYCECPRGPFCYGGHSKGQRIKQVQRKLKKIKSMGVTADSLRLLKALLVELHGWCSDYSSLVVELQETVLSWAEVLEDWDTVISIGTSLLTTYRFMMGEASPVMCTHLTKLALVVMVKKGESDKRHLLLSKALERLCLVYGEDHSLTQTVKEVCEGEGKAEVLLAELLAVTGSAEA